MRLAAAFALAAAAALAAPLAHAHAAPGDGIPPPLEQRRAGVQAGDTECREGLVAALRQADRAACVRPETARALGWPAAGGGSPAPPGPASPAPPDGRVSEAGVLGPRAVETLYPPALPERRVFGALFLDVPVLNGYRLCNNDFNADTFYYGSQTKQWIYACPYEAYGYEHYLLGTLEIGGCGEAIITLPYRHPHTGEEMHLASLCDEHWVNPSVPGPGLPDPVQSANGKGDARFARDLDQAGTPSRIREWLGADGVRSGEQAARFDAAKHLDPSRYPLLSALFVHGHDSAPRAMLFRASSAYSVLPEFLPLDDAVALRARGFSEDRVRVIVVADPLLLSHDPAASHATVNGTLVPLAVSHDSTRFWGLRANASNPVLSASFSVSDVARASGVLISGITDGEGGGLPVVALEDVILEIGLPVLAANKSGYG